MMTLQNHIKFCLLILHGDMGDLRQNDRGGFYHAPSDLPADCASRELISITRSSMMLTAEGANFILENLYLELPTRDITLLRKMAKV